MPRKTVFVHNVSGYVGSHLSKRFADRNAGSQEDGEQEEWEVIGTLASASETKPHWVARTVEPTPEGLEAAFLEADMTVLDCLNALELAEMQLAAIPPADRIPEPKVLVGVSSVMTWTRTTIDESAPEEPLTEAEYKRRRPQVNFKELLALEKLVTKSQREGALRTHVVAAGLTYGGGEGVLHPLFKRAWSGEALPLLTLGDASNLLPTIHVADLCSVVESLLPADPAKPYLVAVDAGQQQQEPQTLAAVTEALSKELGTGLVAPMTQDQVFTTKDYQFFQAGIRLRPAAVDELGFSWHSREGVLANMPSVVREYREARKVSPLRLLVHGNDDLAVGALAAAVAEEYRLPLVRAPSALAAAAEGDDELGAEVKAAGGTVSDETLAKVLARELTSLGCRNQGYILEGCLQTLAQAQLLFPEAAPGEGEEPPAAEAEGEEGAAAPATKAAAPEFVIVLEASQEEVLRKQQQGTDEESLAARLATYETHNAEGSETSPLAHPALAAVETISIASGDATSAEPFLTKARIYLGPPRNYGPSEEELAAAKALADEAAAEAAAAEAAEKQALAEAEAAERARRKAHDERRSAELQQRERELLEVRSQPLRHYLMANVIPTLTEGIIEVCKIKPEDPVDYLAEWLLKRSPVDGPAGDPDDAIAA